MYIYIYIYTYVYMYVYIYIYIYIYISCAYFQIILSFAKLVYLLFAQTYNNL